ncbi:uncharacterized protein LOC142574337 isoform X3 [Dermacentor variabilis]|uniref:uncharacterized protein LOC142574337 isoform X3 n=1 Tax=Dermacentor variabilis TaxID=34621 RepID=UPI003F5BD982
MADLPATAAAVAPAIRFPMSTPSSSETVSRSAYTRNLAVISRETTVIDQTRERFVLLVMITLLLLISVTMFGILFTLLSQDFAPFTTVKRIFADGFQATVLGVGSCLNENRDIFRK